MEANETRAQAMYYFLQDLYHDRVVSIPTDSPTGWRWQRRWVQGWYFNPIESGNFMYHLWKDLTGDVDNDHTVATLDLTRVILNYDNTPEDLGWDVAADLDNDDLGDLDDLYEVLADFLDTLT